MRLRAVWMAVAALCATASTALTQATPLALHAATLSSTLALITWNAPSPASWLLLALDQHSGPPLSLPPDAPSHFILSGAFDDAHSDAAFSLCGQGVHRSDAGRSSSSPLCAHAALPAPSSAVPMDGSAASPWDLSGARLSAGPTVSPDSSLSHRFSWTASPVSTSPSAPPLLYSLFAEWTAPTIDASELSAAQPSSQATIQPTLIRHAIRMRSTHSHSHDQRIELHCDIDQHRLPAGVEITMHLITECDYQRIDAETGASLPHCLTAVSPELRVTLDPLPLQVSLPASPAPTSFTAAPGVALVANDTAVRQALCVFYNQTAGPKWNINAGWCDASVSVCEWFGVGCDSTGMVPTKLSLPVNGLTSDRTVDISPLFAVVNQLDLLDLSANNGMFLPQLDLTPLSKLLTLTLLALPIAPTSESRLQPLLLPSPVCQLNVINIQQSWFAMHNLASCTAVTRLDISSNLVPVPLAIITLLPRLGTLLGSASGLNGDAMGSYGGGLSGGELTLFILAHLNESNPQLVYLDLTGCGDLPFGLANSTDNIPHINSSSLSNLLLESVSLRTGPLGPMDERWLADMPSLTQLVMLGLPDVTLHTSAFQFASRLLTSWTCNCAILGDVTPLLSQPRLQVISLSGSGLRSQLPANLSMVWPQLSVLSCSGCNLFGPLPSFAGLPYLLEVSLDRNSLTGSIGADFAAGAGFLSSVVLSSNLLQGPLPTFCSSPQLTTVAFDSNLIETFPDLTCYNNIGTLQLQSNPMRGELPANLWELLPNIDNLVLSNTFINGTIPDRNPTLYQSMSQFLASDCLFSGRLPRNIDALLMDLSNANFSGPMILFDERFHGSSQMVSLTLASAGQLGCPDLTALTSLDFLVISGNGFAGCDFANVPLPAAMVQLDISNNAWMPFDFHFPAQLVSLRANRANIRGILTDTGLMPNLEEVSLSGNLFNPRGNSDGVSIDGQLRYLLDSEGAAPGLRLFACASCGLTLEISAIMDMVGSTSLIQTLDVSMNDLWFEFPGAAAGLGTSAPTFPPWMRSLVISNNPAIRGRLPATAIVFQAIQQLDFSGTALTGTIPSSWANLPALTQLNIANSSIQCELSINADGRLQCADQTVVSASQTIAIESVSLADPAAGVHCSALTIVATGSSSVTADPSYHSHTECRCDANSFGLNALCSRCPEGCTCNQDHIQNCFPVVRRGSVGVSSASQNGLRAIFPSSIVPFTVSAVLPCPRTVTGGSLCNPDGIAWPSFYRIIETAETDSVSASLSDSGTSSSSGSSELDLSSWCYPGHTGRLCAQCSSGYFSSGRWCLACLSHGAHIVILILNLLVLLALMSYLYAKSPSAATSIKAMALYRQRAGEQALAIAEPLSAAALADETATAAANPLKLLIFHSQQLSLLLHTSTSLPSLFAGLLSVLSSGSNGFSLSSLIAMECLDRGWSLSDRCWLAVAAPALIGLVAGITKIFERSQRSNSMPHDHIQLHDRTQADRKQALLAVDINGAEAAEELQSSVVPRVYSVCVSMLYLIVFPCAQTVLSAVACTDTRETAQSYLNLYPTVPCDAEWRRSVLPPAVLGLLFWVVAFPLGSTLMLLRLRARVAGSEVAASGSAASASALSVWPACSDLLLPYFPRFWYWDQILLMRRLMLVAAVTLIPASSLYLPLCLFAIIQLSALQQHWAQPYAHSLLNAGELASLYLLLINYISAIILQTGLTEGGFQQTANGWAAALFVVNAAFLVILVAGLFSWTRRWTASRWAARKLQR